MAQNLGDAVLDLRTNNRPLRRGLQTAERQTERSTDQMRASYGRVMATVRGLGGAIVAAFSVRAVGQMISQMQQLENRLRTVTDSTNELTRVQGRLFEVAQETRTSYEAIVGLFQRSTIASDELNASQEEMFRLTEIVGKALAVQGGAASESAGALLQLAQSFSSGIVRAEEFNSLLEGAFPLAQAAARGIDETSGSVGQLRNMVIEGEVTSREFFRAILEGGEQIEETFAQTQTTIGQGFTKLGNSLTQFVGGVSDAVGISYVFTSALSDMADGLDRISRQTGLTATPLADQIAQLEQQIAREENFAPDTLAGRRRLEGLRSELRRLRTEQLRTPFGERERIRELFRGIEVDAPRLAGAAELDVDTSQVRELGSFAEMRGLGEIDVNIARDVREDMEKIPPLADQTAGEVEDRWTGLGETIGGSLRRSMADALLGVETNFKETMRRLLVDAGLQRLLSVLSNLPDPVGKIAGFLGGGSGLPGFQHGGSMIARGSGPPDSQLAAFQISPGERVDVTRAGEERGLHQEINIQTGLPAQVVGELHAIGREAGTTAAARFLGEASRRRPSHA